MLSVKRVKTTCGGYGNFCIPVIEISVVKFVTRINQIDDKVQLELASFFLFFLGGGIHLHHTNAIRSDQCQTVSTITIA